MKTVIQPQIDAIQRTANSQRLHSLQNKLASLNARRFAMTTGPDKGPMDWYTINGQTVVVHMYARGGYDVYAPIVDSLSIQATFDALDRIAKPQPKADTLTYSRGLGVGTVHERVKEPTAADKGTAKGIIDDPLWTAYDLERKDYGANNTTNTGADGLIPALS
jgi:hypothetical protein